MTFRVARSLALLALLAAGCGAPARQVGLSPAPAYDQAFTDQWTDGNSELAGYELTYPRYGEARRGTAVTIFVTEPFSTSVRVKSEVPGRPAGDEFPVMKLNLVLDFQTGLYDYNVMTSVFVAMEPRFGRTAGTPVKVSFSAQEWCGHAYAHLNFDRDSVRHTLHSYFDGEADLEETLPFPEDGLSEDALLLWARGHVAPALAPGESRDVSLLTSLATSRFEHVDLVWRDARISRSAESRSVTVPAGTFAVEERRVEVGSTPARKSYPPAGGTVDLPARTWTFLVEKAWPHRLIGWSRSDGLEANMVGAKRLPYWKMNANGREAALKEIGLAPRPPRTP